MVAAVTEFVAETPALGRSFCPGCEPDADPTLEILDVRWCDAHLPHRDGSDDGTSRFSAPSSLHVFRSRPTRSLPYTWISTVSWDVGLCMRCTSSPGTRREMAPGSWRITRMTSRRACPGVSGVTR